MSKYSFRAISLLLSLILSVAPLAVFADTESADVVLPVYNEYATEESLGLLTETKSSQIKRMCAYSSPRQIENEITKCFTNTVTTGFYEESSVSFRNVSEGDTKYTRTYENSGLITYRTKYGIYNAIANSTIAMLISSAPTVGTIISWVYGVVSSVAIDTYATAKAKTYYSYRYIDEKGYVYYNDGGYGWYQRAEVVSRQTYEHYWGYYIDIDGIAHQDTRELGCKRSEYAPHYGQSSWIRNKAYQEWAQNLTFYYEDWQ